MICTTGIIRKSGTFSMATWTEPEEQPYFASFEWEGQVFVVHRKRATFEPETEWAVSHRDTGRKVDGSAARTWRESIDKAREVLAIKGRRRLLAAIRKAKAQEGKDT